MDWNVRSIYIVLLVGSVYAIRYPIPENHQNKDWMGEARKTLDSLLQKKKNENVAKNVIFFLGDGMGVTSVWAARIYTGQRILGNSGEEYEFSFEKFDNVAFSKTYNTDLQVPDSAGTATAFLVGVKANAGTAGVNENVQRKYCENQDENEVTSILDWSLDEGKSVGLVSTARITHATPAAAYAHTAERDWECDTDFMNPEKQPEDANANNNCQFKDIARQLIEDNPNINVILGGGRSKFLPDNITDPEYSNQTGERSDGRDLTQEWQNMKQQQNEKYSYVWNKSQFNDVSPDETDYLFGLFEPSHMQFELDRDTDEEPSLAELTEKAIRILQKNDKGYFLLVEGGRIDHAHHDGIAIKALHDTYAMDEAVKKALEMTSTDDTLIVVTADHSHAFTTAGYPTRGNDILAIVDKVDEPALDNLPYTTLVYGNGPGGLVNQDRQNLTGVNTTHKEYLQQSLVPLDSETHGGEDVGVYAEGPMAHLFRGVQEQNYIAYAMAYASCVGDDKRHCENVVSNSNAISYSVGQYFVLFIIMLYHLL